LDFYSTEWLPHLDQSYDYKNSDHSLSKLLKNLGAEGKPGECHKISQMQRNVPWFVVKHTEYQIQHNVGSL
jgi:hypothetical protein